MRPLACGRAGGDVGDAELLERTAELSRLAFARELFFDGPVIVVADENAVAIAVKAEGTPRLRNKRRSRRKSPAARISAGSNSAARTWRVASSRKPSKVSCGPRSSSQECRLASRSSMSPSRARARRRWRCVGARRLRGEPIPAARNRRRESLAAQRQAFDLAELFAEMVIVKTGIARAGQMQDAGAQACG